ncbi:hypothetical protein J3R83DRAFT_10944 [Lanmaoa asiatica]|nr:hypothetical protein J3R83DRAFT_10944 [Lanmaoa asiatica]
MPPRQSKEAQKKAAIIHGYSRAVPSDRIRDPLLDTQENGDAMQVDTVRTTPCMPLVDFCGLCCCRSSTLWPCSHCGIKVCTSLAPDTGSCLVSQSPLSVLCPDCARRRKQPPGPTCMYEDVALHFASTKHAKMTWPLALISMTLGMCEDQHLQDALRCYVEHEFLPQPENLSVNHAHLSIGGCATAQSTLRSSQEFIDHSQRLNHPANAFVVLQTAYDATSRCWAYGTDAKGLVYSTLSDLVDAFLPCPLHQQESTLARGRGGWRGLFLASPTSFFTGSPLDTDVSRLVERLVRLLRQNVNTTVLQ